MYGLCDCNNFFVSCERLFNPALSERAVVVLSNNDGCVISRSNQAKALGIKMGQPLFEIKEMVKRHDVALFSSNLSLYTDISKRVMSTLQDMVPQVEIYSIDEAFFYLTASQVDTLDAIMRKMRETVIRNTGIPVSIGMAPTKTLAKIATHLCKHYPKLGGCCLMYKSEDIERVLRRLPISEVWGVGRRYTKKLQEAGITTAYEFTQCSAEWVQRQMSIVGVRTWRELRGEPCIDLEHTVAEKQSICVSRSFAKDLYDYDSLHAALVSFVSIAAQKLRHQRGVAAQMQLFIYTNRHRQDLPQHYENQTVCFAVATDDTLELTAHLSTILRKVFSKDYGYKRAGVVLSDISPKLDRQPLLFDTKDRDKQSRLMQAVDALNAPYHHNIVSIASQGTAPLAVNRDYLSPSYTTQWSDILIIKL